MKNLAAQLQSLGIERRFALDIGSVIAGVRPRGLIHASTGQQHKLEGLLDSFGLRIEAFRELYRRHDARSREGILTEHALNDPTAEKWCEIWYANSDATHINQVDLFGNPGKFLGYPDCCRRVMSDEGALARLYRRYLFEDSDRYWELNRLAALFHDAFLMPDFFPCSLSCVRAAEFARGIQSIAKSFLSPNDVKQAISVMQAPMTILGDFLYSWPVWSFSRSQLNVSAGSARKERLSNIAVSLSGGRPEQAVLIGFQHLRLHADHNKLTELVILDEHRHEHVVPIAEDTR